MRSELVMGALKYIPNRYQLTHVAAKTIRAFHRPNTRIADTANEVLIRLSLSDPIARHPRPSSQKPAGSRVVRKTCHSIAPDRSVALDRSPARLPLLLGCANAKKEHRQVSP